MDWGIWSSKMREIGHYFSILHDWLSIVPEWMKQRSHDLNEVPNRNCLYHLHNFMVLSWKQVIGLVMSTNKMVPSQLSQLSQPKPIVYSAALNEKGEVDLLQPWSDFWPLIFLVWWSEPTLAIWSERLAKGPYRKNTPPAVGLESAILRLQIQAFTNWAILAPSFYIRFHGNQRSYLVKWKPMPETAASRQSRWKSRVR